MLLGGSPIDDGLGALRLGCRGRGSRGAEGTLHGALGLTHQPPLLPALHYLLPPGLSDPRPDLLPLPTAEPTTQCQEGIEMAGLPLHPTPLEAGLHHPFARALHDATANGIALLLEAVSYTEVRGGVVG
jgi:hypothetical protein